MQNSVKDEVFLMVILCSLLYGTVFCTEFGPDKAKKEPEVVKNQEDVQKTQVDIKQLRFKQDSLTTVYNEYHQKHVSFEKESNRYKFQNPQYNNMDSLYVLVKKLYVDMTENYNVQEKNLLGKLRNVGNKFCKKNGKYCFQECGRYWTPVGIEDWICVIEENAEKIPNYSKLRNKYDELESLAGLLNGFSEFIRNDMRGYVKAGKKQHKKDNTVVEDSFKKDSLVFDGGYCFVNEVHKHVDGNATKCNTVDNVKQNIIINNLINNYLNRFITYNNPDFMDEKLYKQVMQLALSIKMYNELESGVLSYDKEMKETLSKIEEVKLAINEYKKSLRVSRCNK